MNGAGSSLAVGGSMGVYVWRLRARFLTSSTVFAHGTSIKREPEKARPMLKPPLGPMLVCPTTKDAQTMEGMISANWELTDPMR
jgi:hypothetical protein